MAGLGYQTEACPSYDPERKHGFITRQCEGADVFPKMEPTVPVVVGLSIWAYSHHVWGNLQTYKGPIRLLANFDGTWPGLVATCLELGIPIRVAGDAKQNMVV